MKKLIVFDLDKTLTVGNSWARLNTGLGMTAKEDLHLSSEYQRTQELSKWVAKIIDIYYKRGMPNKKNIENILYNFQYSLGAKECIKELKEKYILAVISGAPNIFTEFVCNDLGIKYFKSIYNLVFDERDFLIDIVAQKQEKITKLKYCQEICNSIGEDIQETIIIGDGDNEELLFNASKYSITFKGSKLEKNAWLVIDNLTDLPKLLNSKF